MKALQFTRDEIAIGALINDYGAGEVRNKWADEARGVTGKFEI